MGSPRTRFYLALVGFLGWVSYLGYLVALTRDPVILSRPQFLPANLYVLAQIPGDENPRDAITLTHVPWSADGLGSELVGKIVEVKPLSFLTASHGWRGAGIYILPLLKKLDGTYYLTPTPPSPGYGPPPMDRYRIYPDTPASRRQLDEIVAKKAR